MDTRVSKISVVGLGKLGSPMAACFASKGYRVIAADLDVEKVGAINKKRAPVYEPGLQELLTKYGERITATQDTAASVTTSDVTFIIVPTPSEPEGGFSLRHVLPVCESIGLALRRKQEFHLVVLTSTVMPGSTGGAVRATLEQVSGKRCGHDFGLCYSPEFIALGSVIRNLLNPDFILIGESDPRSGGMVESVHKNVCENDPPIARMNFINAELAKLSINTFVTTKITFANMLSHICECLPDADVDVVTSAIGLDSRIGHKYLKGAVGYGGPCFPRDNRALASLARQVGASAFLAETTDKMNRIEIDRLTALVKQKLPRGGTVGILGLAYKPDTDVVEESQGLFLAQRLAKDGISVILYDPAAMANARHVLRSCQAPEQENEVRFEDCLEACVRKADVIVVVTPWEEFRSLKSATMRRHGSPRVIIDCWRLLNREELELFADYVGYGTGPRSSERESACVLA